MGDVLRAFLGVNASGSPIAIAAGTTAVDTVGPVIPSGKRVRVICFGGADCGTDSAASIVALQWGAAGAWETIRGFGLAGSSIEVQIGQDFIGNGTQQFRIVRRNQGGASRIVLAWVEGFVAG